MSNVDIVIGDMDETNIQMQLTIKHSTKYLPQWKKLLGLLTKRFVTS